MNILCSYENNPDEKTFFAAGVKKTNLRRSKMTLYVIFFCLFYTGHIKCLFDAIFFARIDIFHMNIRNFCLYIFSILKCVKNVFRTTGSSTPVSQNIMSSSEEAFLYLQVLVPLEKVHHVPG